MPAGGHRIPFAYYGALGASHFRRCIRFSLGDGPGKALAVLALSGPHFPGSGAGSLSYFEAAPLLYDSYLLLFHHYN